MVKLWPCVHDVLGSNSGRHVCFTSVFSGDLCGSSLELLNLCISDAIGAGLVAVLKKTEYILGNSKYSDATPVIYNYM